MSFAVWYLEGNLRSKVDFFFNYKNAWLVKDCAEHLKTNKQTHLLDYKKASPALWGLELPRTCSVLSAPQPLRWFGFQGLFRACEFFARGRGFGLPS